MEAVTDLVAAIATGIALAGAVLAYRRWGWRGVVGVVAVVVGAVLAALSPIGDGLLQLTKVSD